MMKRKDWRDYAPGDLVREIEEAAGIKAVHQRPKAGWHMATFVPGSLAVTFTNLTTRFQVFTRPSFLRANPLIGDFLKTHAKHGVVSGYKVDGDGVLTQWFEVMPRFASDFIESVTGSASVAFQGAVGAAGLPEVPDAFLEGLSDDVWDVFAVESHPALADPDPVSVVRHLDGHTEVIFANSGIWVATEYPTADTPLVRMLRGMETHRSLEDRGPNGWVSGFWGNPGERGGVMYSKWDISLATLKGLLCGVKVKRKRKQKDPEFCPSLPKPTHYCYTVH